MLPQEALDQSKQAAAQGALSASFSMIITSSIALDHTAFPARASDCPLSPSPFEVGAPESRARAATMCNHTTTTSSEQAVAECRAAVEADPSSSQNWRQLGIALLVGAGDGGKGGSGKSAAPLAEAIACLRRSLSLVPPAPNRAGTRHALGLALLRSGDAASACAELERAVESRPADVRLRADLGKALKECARLGAAAEAYRAAIRLRDAQDQQESAPSNLHYRLGMTLRAMLSSPRHCRSPQQRRKLAREARRCLARQLREDPGHSLAAFWLAALEPEVRGGEGEEGDSDGGSGDDDAEATAAAAASNAAAGCPPKMVAALFDKYAPTFDSHLVGALDYATPRRLADALTTAAAAQKNDSGGAPAGRFFRRVADLGCGTGLMGPLLRPMMVVEDEESHLCGVDLSSRMVEVARGRGCYDALEVRELVAWLLSSSSSSFDALVAADVVVYLGDLAPMLEAAAGACSGAGALFAFSTEDADAGDDDDDDDDKEKGDDTQRRRGQDQEDEDNNNNNPVGFVLRPTGRYAHRAAYIRAVAEAAGWAVASLERRSPLRMNAGKRIWGNLVVLRRV
jgi:predicted TPR repeat methyltransferase